ncbi:MAG: CBS domain-containing protein, partial [Deltaproteobacteria bacterium]|nr:CBS domain-containing protein [Deltaproteobacteria bacterium]
FAGVSVREVMRTNIISVDAKATIRSFAESIAEGREAGIYPVLEEERVIGTISVAVLGKCATDTWDATRVGDVANRDIPRIAAEADVSEALRMLALENSQRILFVIADDGKIEGVVTGSDILRALQPREGRT